MVLAVGLIAGAQQAQNIADLKAGPVVNLPYEKVRVLCVGWNDYKQCSGVYDSLQYAEADAQGMAKVFRERFGYETEVLSAESATRQGLYDAIDRLKLVGPNSVFVFFFAGHGETIASDEDGFKGKQRGYLVPPSAKLKQLLEDGIKEESARRATARAEWESKLPTLPDPKPTMPSDIKDDAAAIDAVARGKLFRKEVYDRECIPISDLRERILASDGKHVVMILDACFAGFAVQGSRGGVPRAFNKADRDRTYPLECFQNLQGRSRAVMTAGTANQRSWESEVAPAAAADWKDFAGHGFFTSALLRHLSTQRDPMSASDLYYAVKGDVITKSISKNKETRMEPQYRLFGDEDGEFVFVPRPDEDWRKEVAKLLTAGDTGAGKRIGRGAMVRKRANGESSVDLLVAAYQASHPAQVEDLTSSPRWTRWFGRAKDRAEAGDAEAMGALYYAYSAGLGTPRDARKAAQWAQEAQETGAISGKAIMSDALSKGITQSAEEQMAEQLRKEAAAQQTAMGGGLVAIQGAAGGRPDASFIGVLSAMIAFEQMADSPQKAMAGVTEAKVALGKLASEAWNGGASEKRVQTELAKILWAADRLGNDAAERRRQQQDGLFPLMGPTIANRLRMSAHDLQSKTISKERLQAAMRDIEELSDQLYVVYATAQAPTK